MRVGGGCTAPGAGTALVVPDETALRSHLPCVGPVAFRTGLIFAGPDWLRGARSPYHRGVFTLPPEHPAGGLC